MSLWNTITDFVEPAWEFITGEKTTDFATGEVDYIGGLQLGDVYEFGKSFLDSDIVKTGAQYFLDSKGEPVYTDPKIEMPKIARTASTVNVAGLASLRNPVGVNNPQVQTAMRRMSQRTNISPQLQRIVDANMTTRQGRRTIGLGATTMPRVSPTAPAAVRKVSTKEVI
jgi:hypothetical protein